MTKTEPDYKLELERAYRALRGIYGLVANGRPIPDATLAYHSLTLGAAMRFVGDDALDGSEYFIGKDASVLHEVLKRYGGRHIPPLDISGATKQ